MKKKQLMKMLLLALLPVTGYSQGFPTINMVTPITDMRIGTALTGVNNVGIFKYSMPTFATSNELGIYTWADGNPIRIGGNIVKFQHESGNPNDVLMFGNLGVGTGTLDPLSQLTIDVTAPGKRTGAIANLNSVTATSFARGYIAEVHNNYINQGIYANTTGGDYTHAGVFIAEDGSVSNIGVDAVVRRGQTNVGGQFITEDAVVNGTGVSGSSHTTNGSNSISIGGKFYSRLAEVTKGVDAYSEGNKDNNINYGVYSNAFQMNGTTNYGVYSNAGTHPGAVQNFGVYSRAQVAGSTCTNYGVYSKLMGGMAAPNPANGAGSYAGYFWDNSAALGFANGAAFFNGVAVAVNPGFTAISDRKFKKDIVAIDNVMDKIMKLSPVTYTFKSKDEFPSFAFPQGKQLGFIAQELEKVFPELVHQSVNPAQYDDKGNKIADKVEFKGVEYTSLIPVLTKAIQEQQKQIDELKAIIANSTNNNNNTGIGDNVDGKNTGYLNQNIPNPFTEKTVISYQLPANTKVAAIGVYDLNGREIKLFTLSNENTGSVTIDGGSMQAGMYVYSLLINGQPYATKKMVLTSH